VIIFFQGEVEKITGYKEVDFTSGTVRWDELIYPKDLPEVKKINEEFYNSFENSKQLEYRIIDKNRNVHWILESVQKIYDVSNNKEGVQGTIIDITDKKEAEELILEEIKKLTELNRVKVDLIETFNYKNRMQVPKLEKIILNMGLFCSFKGAILGFINRSSNSKKTCANSLKQFAILEFRSS